MEIFIEIYCKAYIIKHIQINIMLAEQKYRYLVLVTKEKNQNRKYAAEEKHYVKVIFM